MARVKHISGAQFVCQGFREYKGWKLLLYSHYIQVRMQSKSHSSHFGEIFNVNKETNGESETHIRCSVCLPKFSRI